IGIASATYSTDYQGNYPSFRSWLYTKRGDLTSGRLYPYLNSKRVYLCPTDEKTLASKNRPRSPTTTAPPVFGGRTQARDYSYSMNCAICHPTDLANFREPAKTLLLLEAELAPNDYTGQ